MPARKRHCKAEVYVMFNSSLNTLLITTMDVIKQSNIIFKNTKYTKREPFFSVPLSCFRMWKLVGNQ